MVPTYAATLKVDGWTDEGLSAEGFSATTEGAWLDVVVTDEASTVSVCVWDVKPESDQCAEVGPSLEGTDAVTTTTPTTTTGG